MIFFTNLLVYFHDVCLLQTPVSRTTVPSLSSVGGPVNPSAGVSTAPGSGGGMKLDFTFDPELARIAELKDRSGGNVTPPATDMTHEASADLNMKVRKCDVNKNSMYVAWYKKADE